MAELTSGAESFLVGVSALRDVDRRTLHGSPHRRSADDRGERDEAGEEQVALAAVILASGDRLETVRRLVDADQA